MSPDQISTPVTDQRFFQNSAPSPQDSTSVNHGRQLGDEKKTHSPPEYEGDVSPATFVSQRGSPFSYVSHFMKMELDNSYTDIVLIVCGFVAGLVDGLSFNAWGSFSSMQTGTYMADHS